MAEIIDLNIYPTIETVDVTIETIIDNVSVIIEPTNNPVNLNITPNLITINVNRVTGGGAVSSVNTQTGDVVLTQDDVLDGTTYKQYSLTEKNKLAGIAAGAEVNVNADWNATTGDAQILNKPSLATVATSGSYIDLTNKPTIPDAQIQSDWTQANTSALDYIKNKPTIPSLTGYVPYTGATTDLDLGTYNLTADHIALNVSPSGAGFVVGATEWNNDLGSSQTLLKGGNVTLKNGVDLVARVVNKVTPNTTLTKAAYQVVKVSGAQGQRLAVDLAQANTDLNSADTLGIVTETIATNQEGFILTVGQLLDVNTTGSLQGETWADGDVLYLSPTTAGKMTNIKPNGSNGHIVVLGYVEYSHSSQGKIYVKIMNGWELDELHNVYISSVADNQILTYESSTQLWKNKNLNQIVSERRNANNTSNNSINYCGTAPNGSAESATVWTIKRLTIAASGSITTATATNVAWTNRQSATYT